MRYIVAALLMVVFVGPVCASDSVTFGYKVITIGDGVGRVYEVAGKPDRVVTLQNRFGAAVGERLEYYRDGKTTMITIRSGQVVAIEEVR